MLFTPKDIPKLRRQMKGKRVVFVAGCFDIVHEGHIQFLNKAAEQGDALVVGVLSSAYIRAKKKREPVHTQRQRALLIDALKPVSATILVPFSRGKFRSLPVLRALRPAVLFRSEKNHRYLPIQKELEALGITLVAEPMRKLNSTTRTIKRVRRMSL